MNEQFTNESYTFGTIRLTLINYCRNVSAITDIVIRYNDSD